jgi:prevent-host-death family protein
LEQQMKAGIRELKRELSAYLRRVKAGESITITERGVPVGRIVPIGQPVAARIKILQEAGLVLWDGGKLAPLEPVAKAQGGQTVAELLVEDRA